MKSEEPNNSSEPASDGLRLTLSSRNNVVGLPLFVTALLLCAWVYSLTSSFLILMWVLLLSGWILSLSSKGAANRTLIIISPMLGAVLGGFCGNAICRFLFGVGGVVENEFAAWICGGLPGAVIGLGLLTAMTLIFTRRNHNYHV